MGLGQGRQTLHRDPACTERKDSRNPLQPCTPQTSSPAGTTLFVSEHLSNDGNQGCPTTAKFMPRSQAWQNAYCADFFTLEYTPSVVALKIILSIYVQGKARAARSELNDHSSQDKVLWPSLMSFPATLVFSHRFKPQCTPQGRQQHQMASSIITPSLWYLSVLLPHPHCSILLFCALLPCW